MIIEQLNNFNLISGTSIAHQIKVWQCQGSHLRDSKVIACVHQGLSSIYSIQPGLSIGQVLSVKSIRRGRHHKAVVHFNKHWQCELPLKKKFSNRYTIFILLQIVQTFRVAISPSAAKDFFALANKLSGLNLQVLNIGSADQIVVGFKTLNAALLFLEQSLGDLSKLNLKK